MFEYDNTHVFNVNMIVTMENIVAEEKLYNFHWALFIHTRTSKIAYYNDYHQLFLVSWILNIYNPCYTYFVQQRIL